jgi:flagellar hook assembly protein FlgD
LTYQIGINVPFGAASSVIITDTVPAGLDFVSVTPPLNPPGSVNVISLPTPGPTAGTGTLLVWTFPSIPPGTYTLDYLATVKGLTPGGKVIVNEAALTYPQNPVPQVVQAPVTVLGDYTVRINVYNEAGEVVKTILMTKFSEPVDNVSLKASDTLVSINDRIDIVYQGSIIGTWDGTNNGGDLVSNGKYYIKIDNIDPYGSITSVSQLAMVARHLAHVQVNIYNQAGEVVRHLAATVDDAVTLTNNLTVSSGTVAPSYQGGPNSTVFITLGDGTQLTWDGRNDNGQIVSSGQYFVEIRTNDGMGGDSQVTKQITVIHQDLTLGSALVTVYPNPLSVRVDGNKVNFVPNAPVPVTLAVRVYTMAGELVQEVRGNLGDTLVTWDFSNNPLASGLYLLVIESRDAQGGLQRQITKLAIFR